jgi:hypothetical protein
MIKKIRILKIAAVLLFICVNAFSSEVITGNEPEPPRVVITENDRMTFDFNQIVSGFKFPRLRLLNMEFKNRDAILLFDSAGLKDLFEEFLDKYESYNLDYNSKSLSNIVKKFNNFLSQSQENRDKIAEILNQRLKKEWEEKHKDRDKELNRQNYITTFIGLKSTVFSELGGGLYLAFLFPTSENVKIGFSFDLLHRQYFMNFNYVHWSPYPAFFGADISLAIKINWFNINLGIGLYKNVSGDIQRYLYYNYYDKKEVANSEYSVKVSMGWMYDKKIKFFAGLGYRYVLKEVTSEATQHCFLIDLAIGF